MDEFEETIQALADVRLALNALARRYGHASFVGVVLLGYLEQVQGMERMVRTLEVDAKTGETQRQEASLLHERTEYADRQ